MTGIPKVGQRTDEALGQAVETYWVLAQTHGFNNAEDEREAWTRVRSLLAAVPDVAETIAREIEAARPDLRTRDEDIDAAFKFALEVAARIARAHTTRQDTEAQR